MAYTIASFLRTGNLDSPKHRAIRKYLWKYRWEGSEWAYSLAIAVLIQEGYLPIMAHEIVAQYNKQCDKRKPLSQVVKSA